MIHREVDFPVNQTPVSYLQYKLVRKDDLCHITLFDGTADLTPQNICRNQNPLSAFSVLYLLRVQEQGRCQSRWGSYVQL